MITINGLYPRYNMSGISSSQNTGSAHFQAEGGKKGLKARHCNICRQRFTPEYKYQLFCGKCRTTDDSFIFNEWLPRVPVQHSLAA